MGFNLRYFDWNSYKELKLEEILRWAQNSSSVFLLLTFQPIIIILHDNLVFNPTTLALGDFHPCNCVNMIFIVLPLSELPGSLGSLMLLPDVTEGRLVPLLLSLVFSTGTCLVMCTRRQRGQNIFLVGVYCISDAGRLCLHWKSSQLHYYFFKEIFVNDSLIFHQGPPMIPFFIL